MPQQKQDSFVADSFEPDQPSQFAGMQGGSSTTAGDTGVWAAVKRGLGNLVSPITHPIDTAKGLVSEGLAYSGMNAIPTTLSRVQAAMAQARTEEGGDEGLHPYFHGAIGAIPMVGGHLNELTERANYDPSGAFTQAATEFGLPSATAKAGKAGLNKMAPSLAERVNLYATRGVGATGKDRVTLGQGALDTTVREAGVDPIAQRAGDVRVFTKLKDAKDLLNATAMETPTSTTVPKWALKGAVEKAINAFDPANPTNASAVKQLQYWADEINALPDNGNFHQVNRIRQQIDGEIARSGKFTQAVRGDVASIAAEKQLAGMLRDLVGEHAADPKRWADANRSYSAWKTRAELVETRRPEVLAAKSKGIDFDTKVEAQKRAAAGPVVYPKEQGLPGIGTSAVDDAGAVAAGNYMAGGPGAVAAGGTNLLTRNLRRPGFSRVLAKGNELGLKLTGKEYGDFYPPTELPPSDFVKWVRETAQNPPMDPLVGSYGRSPVPSSPAPVGDLLSPRPPGVPPLVGSFSAGAPVPPSPAVAPRRIDPITKQPIVGLGEAELVERIRQELSRNR